MCHQLPGRCAAVFVIDGQWYIVQVEGGGVAENNQLGDRRPDQNIASACLIKEIHKHAFFKC